MIPASAIRNMGDKVGDNFRGKWLCPRFLCDAFCDRMTLSWQQNLFLSMLKIQEVTALHPNILFLFSTI